MLPSYAPAAPARAVNAPSALLVADNPEPQYQPCTPSARTRVDSLVRLRIVQSSSQSDSEDGPTSCQSPTYRSQKAMQRLGFATVMWGCVMIIASIMLLVRTNTPLTAIGGVVGVNWGAGNGAGKRHEIHVPASRRLSESGLDAPVTERVAVLYSVYGAWHEETEWEFLRLVDHVLRSEALASHDVVLLWETFDSEKLPAHTPLQSAAVMQVLQDHANRVSLFQTSTAEASKRMPETAFSKGFYFNPEVAAIMFLDPLIARAVKNMKPGTFTPGKPLPKQLRPYEHVWLFESDVRFTGNWESLLLTPYTSKQAAVDLFAFRTAQPWVYQAPGWESSNCFVPLAEYPTGWRARGENSTNLPLPWGQRRACFMPTKRMSFPLLQTLNETYLSGLGGYNEVAVPSINAMHDGTFGTAPLPCMRYSYKNSEASAMYDNFRRTLAQGASESTVEHNACLLHPVKSGRSTKNY